MENLDNYEDYIVYSTESKSVNKVSGCYNESEGLRIAQQIYSALSDIGEIMESELSDEIKLQRFTCIGSFIQSIF